MITNWLKFVGLSSLNVLFLYVYISVDAISEYFLSQVASLDVKIEKNYCSHRDRPSQARASIHVIEKSFFCRNETATFITLQGPVVIKENLIHSFISLFLSVVKLLSFDGYQLNMIEITGLALNWINKFD